MPVQGHRATTATMRTQRPARQQPRHHSVLSPRATATRAPSPCATTTTQAHSPRRHRRARVPQNPHVDTEHLHNDEKVGAVPPRSDDAPTEPDYDAGAA